MSAINNQPETESDLPRSIVVSYVMPVLPIIFLFGPLPLLQGIYAKYYGLPLTAIATVLVIGRLFDAITDPLIGYAVDHHIARGGSRKPFLVGGVLLLILSSWFLYIPQGDVSIEYFLGWYLTIYFAFTLFEIPHIAWPNKLTAGIQDRSTLFTLRALAGMVGGLLFFVVPQLPFFESSDITPQTLEWTVYGAYCLLLPAVWLCLAYTPDDYTPDSVDSRPLQKDSLKKVLQSIVINRPLVILLLACACIFFAGGMGGMILFLFVDVYLGMGDKFALASMLGFGASLLSLKCWHYGSQRWDLKKLWVAGIVIMAIGAVGTGLLSPGDHWLWLIVWMMLTLGGGSVFAIAMPALMSKMVDYGTWKFGAERSAMYFSTYTFLNKTISALGGSLGLAIAGWYGFDATASEFSESAVFGLRLSIVWIPSLILLVGAALVLAIPMTDRQYKAIRHRLDQRQSHQLTTA